MSPVRYDLLQETNVIVTISNRFSRDLYRAEKTLVFTYIPPPLLS